MRLAVMQPYFLPYIGYFQLISAVDSFIVYDNIKYTKKGWINRNRLLRNGSDALFSLPLKRDSDALTVAERELATDFNRAKMLNQFKGAYVHAPFFAETWPVLEEIVLFEDQNLFRFIYHSICKMCDYLRVPTEIRMSSLVPINHDLKSQEKVIALCQATGADSYINPIGGSELYNKSEFRAHQVELSFLKSAPFEYRQFDGPFVPWLSIVDVLMFNRLDHVRALVGTNYELS